MADWSQEAKSLPRQTLPSSFLKCFMQASASFNPLEILIVMSSELRIFVPLAIRAVMNSLVPRMEVAAGMSVEQKIDLNPTIPERILSGEVYDIGLTNPSYAKTLVAEGYADGPSHSAFGRIPLAVGQRAGISRPISKDVKEIKALFHGAKSIAYTGAGTSGRTYLDVINRLDLNNTVLSKSQAMGGGEPVASVAAGETELAIAPLTTILSTPGLAPAAIFPEGLVANIDISIFLSTKAQPSAATVLTLLTASELDGELAAAGVLRFKLN